LIVSGSLDGVSLQTTLKELGYQGFVSNGEDPFSIVLLLAVTPMVLLSLAIFLLIFMSLTLIYRIKSLRQAGIRLIAGVPENPQSQKTGYQHREDKLSHIF